MSSAQPAVSDLSQDDCRELGRIDRALVHRSHTEHVFISPIAVVAGEADRYEADVVVDQRHVFFYEHPLDHVPGLLLVEAVRQMGTAVTHLYYGAPAASAFVIDEMRIQYAQFAEHELRLQIRMRVHDVTRRRGRVASLACACAWWQSGRQLGTMDARWSVYDSRTMARLRAARRAVQRSAGGNEPDA